MRGPATAQLIDARAGDRGGIRLKRHLRAGDRRKIRVEREQELLDVATLGVPAREPASAGADRAAIATHRGRAGDAVQAGAAQEEIAPARLHSGERIVRAAHQVPDDDVALSCCPGFVRAPDLCPRSGQIPDTITPLGG